MEYTKDSRKICTHPEIDKAMMVSTEQLSRKLINEWHSLLFC